MNKPESLRAHLLAAVPALSKNPDRLLTFVEDGSVHATSAASLSFEYRYQLQIILTDYPGSPDAVMLAVIGWARTQQPDLLGNPQKTADGIRFEAEIIDKSKVDLSITLALSESVVALKNAQGKYDVSHPAEPALIAPESTAVEVVANGEVIARWDEQPAPDLLLLDMPMPKAPRRD